jgi:hypothetical protein
MKLAGHSVHDMSIRNQGTRASSPVPGLLFGGESRLTLQRWRYWKDRFTEISKRDGVADEPQRTTGEAHSSMVQVEG